MTIPAYYPFLFQAKKGKRTVYGVCYEVGEESAAKAIINRYPKLTDVRLQQLIKGTSILITGRS